MAYPSDSDFLAFKHPIISIRLSEIIETRPQTPPNTTEPDIGVRSTPGHRGSAHHSASDASANLEMNSAAPLIARNVEKNDKSDVHSVLGFLLGQCATWVPDTDPVVQRSREFDLLTSVLDAVIPICNRPEIKDKVKNYCKEVQVKQDRYQPFVELFNNVLQETEKIENVGLRDRSLVILFHNSDPSEVHAVHNGMETIRKPDIGATQLDTAKAIALREHENRTWEELSEETAFEEPGVSFSWSNLLAAAEFKLGLKYCDDPPETYGTKLTKEIPHIEDIRRPLRITSVGQTSDLSKTPEPSVAPPRKPLSIRELLKQRREAQQRPQQQAAENSEERTEVIPVDEMHKKGATGSQPSARSEQISMETDSANNTVPPVVQTAIYGTEMLCRGPYASHVITLLILDDVVWIWWFDRQGAIQSAGINFVQDLPYFVVLLVAFQRFDLEHWGVIEAFTPYEILGMSTFDVEFPEERLVVSALSGADIYERYNLMGRCTRVYTAIGATDDSSKSLSTNPDIGEDLPDMDLALKIYWPEESRPNEAHILEKAHKLGKSNPAIKNHIPVLLAFYDHAYSTGTIRSRLGVDAGGKGPLGGPRVLRILLFKKLQLLDPRELSIDDFMHGWRQCLTCHFYLWKGGIEHGDISLGNLMWDDENKNGVLGDFDLATLRDSPQKRGGECTGTIPFMAIDLLDKKYFDGKIVRLYRHDVESFVWVLIWVFLRNDDTWDKRSWDTSNYNLCRGSKWYFVLRGFREVEVPAAEGDLWRLVIALMGWVRLVNDRPLEGTRRDELSNEIVFKEVTAIIDANWVWN